MLSRLIISVVILCLLFSSKSASACMMSAEGKEKLFKQFDSNKDGYLSLDEYVSNELVRILEMNKNTLMNEEDLKKYSINVPTLDKEFLEKRYRELMDKKNKRFIGIDKFQPISFQKCM